MLRRRTREGFTLIELLVTTAVVSILTAIAIPRYSFMKEQAYVTTMKSDLRNFMLAEELYYSQHKTYTTDTSALGIRMSSRVTAVIRYNNGYGLYASATHPGTSRTCEVEVGGGASTSPGNRQILENVIVCSGGAAPGSGSSSGSGAGGESGTSGGGTAGGGSSSSGNGGGASSGNGGGGGKSKP
jgi:prepilin-type N-terminal cleavage/methylation domain-containing protein